MIISQKIEIGNKNEKNFSEVVKDVFSQQMKCGREAIREYLECMDEEILSCRDSKRYRNKGKRSTSVKTSLGTIEYERRIYFDTETQTHVYLLDEKIHAKSIGQADSEICKSIGQMICSLSYRETAEYINQTTGLQISGQGVWDIVQKMGEQQIAETKQIAELVKHNKIKGNTETKLLYEESDGDWLKLQGKDRKKYGKSKEMKIGIAYDGVIHHTTKNGKIRKELDGKVAYASFESASDFKIHKEAMVASRYNVDEIELRIKNGDGAQWIQKDNSDCECICVLDEYHRNKKITECVGDKGMADELRQLLLKGEYTTLLDAIEAYSNSVEDKSQSDKLKELYRYYKENFNALSGYYERGVKIPETRDPGVIHHAGLGSMESNVFTVIGNRMKGRRACWSVSGGNNLAALLCKRYSDGNDVSDFGEMRDVNCGCKGLSAAQIKQTSGKGYEYPFNFNTPSNMSFLRNIAKIKPI